MTDPNEGSAVLFRRLRPDAAFGEWEVGYIKQTFFVDAAMRIVAPSFDYPEYTPWVTIVPAAPEGRSAPTTLSVPLDAEHIDPIVYGAVRP